MIYVLGLLFVAGLVISLRREGIARKEYFKEKRENPRPWWLFHNYNKKNR